MRLLIERFAWTRYGTLGRMLLEADDGAGLVDGYTIELPWRGNAVGESCIPLGGYIAQRHDSSKFGSSLWLRDVPGRTEILVHPANSRPIWTAASGPVMTTAGGASAGSWRPGIAGTRSACCSVRWATN